MARVTREQKAQPEAHLQKEGATRAHHPDAVLAAEFDLTFQTSHCGHVTDAHPNRKRNRPRQGGTRQCAADTNSARISERAPKPDIIYRLSGLV